MSRKLTFKKTLEHPFKRVAYDESDTNKELMGVKFYCTIPWCDYWTYKQSFHKCPQCGATYSCKVRKSPYSGRERARILNKFRRNNLPTEKPIKGVHY